MKGRRSAWTGTGGSRAAGGILAVLLAFSLLLSSAAADPTPTPAGAGGSFTGTLPVDGPLPEGPLKGFLLTYTVSGVPG